MSRHIGIVGVSPEGAALCVRQISRRASELLSPRDQPRISLHNEPLAHYIEAIQADDWHRVGDLLRRSAELLAACGADFCLTPDNAVQYAIHLAEHDCPVPWLTLPELVADAVVADHRQTVGVIGTKWVTSGAAYQTHLGLRGVQVLAPEGDEIERLNQIIIGELVYGRVHEASRRAVIEIVERLAARGCEGLIVGSSEVPLVVSAETSPLPLYDAGDILAQCAVRRAAV